MSETEKTTPVAEKETATAHAAKAGKGKPPRPAGKPAQGNGTAFFATVLALVAMAISYYLWQQQQVAEHKLATVTGSLERLLTAVEQQHRQQQVRIEALDRRQPGQTQRLLELEQQLQQLRGYLARQSKDWELAEVDYLLRIAEHRLQLEANPVVAMVALRNAQSTLELLDDPVLSGLREAIAADMQRLQQLPAFDRTDLSRELSALEVSLGALTLKQAGSDIGSHEERSVPSEEQQSGWRGLTQRIWADLRGLVVVRHQDGEWLGPPAPGQRENLQWMLQMHMQAAQLALLSGQQTLWQQHLQRAQDWLVQHFDPATPAYRQIEQGLQALVMQPLQPAMPDLQPTIRLLESLLLQAGQAAVPNEAPLPAQVMVEDDPAPQLEGMPDDTLQRPETLDQKENGA